MAANHVVIRVPSSCPPQEKQISCGGPVNSLAPMSPLERFSGGQQQSTNIHHVVSICTDIVTAPGAQVKMMNMIDWGVLRGRIHISEIEMMAKAWIKSVQTFDSCR